MCIERRIDLEQYSLRRLCITGLAQSKDAMAQQFPTVSAYGGQKMKIKNLSWAFAVCTLMALLALSASAQVGRIEGDVLKTGTTEPIVGAQVEIVRTDIKGSYPVKTDKKGHFL